MARKPTPTRTTGRKAVKDTGHRAASDRAAKVAAVRAAAARGERRRKLAIGTSAAVLIGAVAAAVTVVALAQQPAAPKTGRGALPTMSAAGRMTRPPWPAPADPSARIRAAGLQMSDMEGTATHFHAHLDIFVAGREVPVTADIGIDQATGAMSELHTHDTSGVLHVESPATGKRYVLGQLFNEWDVRLDASHLGGLTTGNAKTLTAYVDGKPVTGNPAQIELLGHRQIALVYGKAGQKVDVPSSYAFAEGE